MTTFALLIDPSAFLGPEDAKQYLLDNNFEVLNAEEVSSFYFKIEAEAEQLSELDDIALSIEEYHSEVNVKLQDLNTDHLDYTTDQLTGAGFDRRFTGLGAHVFLLDTGVKSDHTEFENNNIVEFYTRFQNDYSDSVGHGTAVASLIIGENLGVAPDAIFYNSKIYDADNSAIIVGDIVDALDAVVNFYLENLQPQIAVVCLPWTIEYNELVNSYIDYMGSLGIVVVCAAGNNSAPITSISPASTPSALTVGAFNRDYQVAAFTNTVSSSDNSDNDFMTNYGSLLDIFALGVEVQSAAIADSNSYQTVSGTSLSTGIVAGVAAYYAEMYAGLTGSEIKNTMVLEGNLLGDNLLTFPTANEADYEGATKSIAVTLTTKDTLTNLTSGYLGKFEIGTTATVSLQLKEDVEDVEILDFAPAPPWASVDTDTGVVNIDTTTVGDDFPGEGKYLFAIKGTMNGDIVVSEISILLLNDVSSDPQMSEVLAFYYDSESDSYDEVQISAAKTLF